MHTDQVDVTESQVAALLTDQVPVLAGLRVVAWPAPGTVHAIFRIGAHAAGRFPRRLRDPEVVASELGSAASAANEFRAASAIPSPEPIHVGRPGRGFPMPWSVHTWVPGTTATPLSCAHSSTFAADLASLLRELRGWPTRGRRFEGGGRGGDLRDHDEWVLECIRRNGEHFDADALTAMWVRFRVLGREDPDVMSHTDLIPANLLVDDDRLVGVLDTGGFGAADPALDLVGAWHLFEEEPRARLRDELGCSDLQWERGKAWAFQQAVGLPWYYRDTNPVMAALGACTLRRLMAAEVGLTQ
ncbi:MAG: phosphotransferase [Acidimicrobiales bacterium]